MAPARGPKALKLFRGLFTLVILIPLAAAVVIFAVHNRASVALDLWPLPFNFAPPLYVLVAGIFVVGFLAGGLVAWLSGGRARGRARTQRYRLMDIERKEAETKQAESAATAGLPAISKS